MKKKMTILTTAVAMAFALALPASAGGPPKGAGEGGKPAGIECQQKGIGTLQDLGLLSAVAKDGPNGGIEVVGLGTIPFKDVLSLHRTNPELFSAGTGVSVVIPDVGVVPATWCTGL